MLRHRDEILREFENRGYKPKTLVQAFFTFVPSILILQVVSKFYLFTN
jgi:hypothetical protein